MAKGVAYRPLLLPPRGRQLERSYRPWLTCFSVSFAITILICVVFGLTAYNIFVHRFGRTQHKYHSGDEVSLLQAGKDLSSVFCSAYNVRPYFGAELFLLPSEARLDPAHRVNRTFSIKLQPRNYLYTSQIYYLNKESHVQLTACRHTSHEPVDQVDDFAEFVVIEGDAHYQEWIKYFNSRHTRNEVPIPINATCDGNTALPHLNFDVLQPDNFYFVLVSGHHGPKQMISLNNEKDEVILMGLLNETRLNVTGSLNVCHINQSECDFPLTWDSKRDVVARIQSGLEDQEFSFSTDCLERITFWIPIFGVLPVVLVSLASLWCWCLLVRRRSVRDHYLHSNRDTPVTPTGYGSIREESTPPLAQPSSSGQEEELCGASIQNYPIEDD